MLRFAILFLTVSNQPPEKLLTDLQKAGIKAGTFFEPYLFFLNNTKLLGSFVR
jgi:hypothetical protein